MTTENRACGPANPAPRAVFLTMLMLLSSIVPILTTSAQDGPQNGSWAKEGSHDTGWVQLDATGADSINGIPAMVDWTIEFAPGATLDNLSFEIMVDGGNGISIQEPLLVSPDTGLTLFDWRGNGWLGQTESFDGNNPHQGRLSPTSDVGATFTLPAGTEITDLVIEALAPADPVVALKPIDLSIQDAVPHPVDGRLYAAVGDTLVMLDANSNPNIIDMVRFENSDGIYDLHIDVSNNRILVLTVSEGIQAVDLSTTEILTPLAAEPMGGTFSQTIITANGDNYAMSENGLWILNSAGSGWTLEQASNTTDWPVGTPWKTIEHNGVLYVSLVGGGVGRYDTSTSTTLSHWSTANNLHSDYISDFVIAGSWLLISSWDAGIARHDVNGNFWLATWTSSNWLASNVVQGMTVVANQVDILAGDAVQSYDTTSGSFTARTNLVSLGQINDGEDILLWPAGGSRAPATDQVLVTDGHAVFGILEPGNTPFYAGDLIIGSGPSNGDMSDALEINGIVYVGSEEVLDRYSISQSRWLAPVEIGDIITRLASSGTDIIVATDGGGVHVVANGTIIESYDDTDGLQANRIKSIDAQGDLIALVHYSHGMALINRTTSTITTYAQGDAALQTNALEDIALLGNIAYIATADEGLARYDIANDTFLGSWRSTGIDGVGEAPITISGDIVYLGLPGYGVIRKNIVTDQILDPLRAGANGRGLPSSQIYALHTLGNGDVLIGTNNGARVWDGSSFHTVSSGNGWPRPTTFMDFVDDGTNFWAATNAGVCKFSISSRQLDDCINQQDGLGNTYTTSIDMDGTDIYAATWASGLSIIDTTSDTVTDNWESGGTTNRALVEVIGDVAYLGLYNIGIARYDLTTNEWLPIWDASSSGLLQGDEITTMHLGRYADQLWIGGDFGFQVINVSAGTEVVHISQDNSMYSGSDDPYQMVIAGNTVYYHGLYYQGDEIHRIDLDNLSAMSSLDAGAQFGVGSWMYGMSAVNGVLYAAVEPSWNQNGQGGIATYNLTNKSWGPNIDPTGEVNIVQLYTDNSGNRWISWGEASLELYDSSGILQGEWDSDDLDLPIREILEYDGEVLFATEEGVARYDSNSSQWLSTWTPGNGLDSSFEDVIYGMWTDGADLWVGSARSNGWQVRAEIGVLDSSGNWTVYSNGGNIPAGYPTSFVECAGIIHIAMNNNWNGGVARFDIANDTWLSAFTQGNNGLADDTPGAVTCDSQDILYVGYYADDQPISRFNYNTGHWIGDIDQSSHGISSDRVYWDSLAWGGGRLMIGHGVGSTGGSGNGGSEGGFSTLTASGTSASQASVQKVGAAVTTWEFSGTTWLYGQAGGATGYSHVDEISQLGINTVNSLPGLVNGEIQMFDGNSTHIWAATGNGNSAGGLLEGTYLPNGSIEWTRGWSAYGGQIVDIELVGDILYTSVQGVGMILINLTSGVAARAQNGFHNYPDQIVRYGDDLVIGLEGTWSTSAGVQIWNTTQMGWTGGRLLAGLPSNVVTGVEFTTGYTYIATSSGLGVFNLSSNDWDNPLTTMDGLSSNVINDVKVVNGKLLLATPIGLDVIDSNGITTLTRADGLLGNSIDQILVVANDIYLSHDGLGSERPGFSIGDGSNQTISFIAHQIDQLPSNTVLALASDYRGLFIATDESPMIFWNRSSNQHEIFLPWNYFTGWPVQNMRSNADRLVAVGANGIAAIDWATPSNFASFNTWAQGITGATGASFVGANIWISTDDGLRGFFHPSHEERESSSMRRAHPLSIGFNNAFTDVTNMTHPGMAIVLVDAANAVTLSDDGTTGPHGVLMQTVPLTLSSPVSGAATWVQLNSLLWNSTLDISNASNLMTNMQYIIDNGRIINGTNYITLRLQSPSNGSLWVKLNYDWHRSETPIQAISLWDRPDDGGQTLVANWTQVNDDDFASYVVYLNEGPWATQPNVVDLQPFQPDAAIGISSRLQTEISTIGGQPLQDGVDYYAVVVVKYTDGRYGTPSAQIGPASSSDEIPAPPLWASGAPHDGGEDGDLAVEWARCTALDLASTRIYASTTPITDVLGMSVHTSVPPQDGNSTVIGLAAGQPHWLGFTCVDQSGQEDLVNATIIGPVVPTGGLNDGVAPPKLADIWAEDVPEDDGGRVRMGWTPSVADDCAFVTVYMRPVGDGDDIPASVDDFAQAVIVPDCETNMTIIDAIGDFPLIDGQTYFIGAVASDKWLNSDTGDVTILQVTPYVNNIGGSSIPERIGELSAWDHPGDDGTAIDVAWVPSEVDDFDYYVIWTSAHPIDDLSNLAPVAGTDPALCGCIKMNKQWVDEAKSPIEILVNTALYGGDNLLAASPAQVMPNVELFVAVTVHDIKGNVHLDGLTTVSVIPIDNLADQEAPDKLTDLYLVDRPMDDGTAVLLDFGLSDASDIDHYEIYAAAYSFDSVGQGGNGPATPIETLGRSPSLPLSIDLLAHDTPVVPNMQVTVAVVAVDSSGNAHMANLVTASAISVDDGFQDPGSHLPDIDGISLSWIGNSILVEWDHSNDASVRSYVVFISDEEFIETDDATMVGEVSAINSLLITPNAFTDLDNTTEWWVGVAAQDEIIHREMIDSIQVLPPSSVKGDGDETGKETPSDFSQLLGSDNMMLIGLAVVAILLLLLVIRSRGGRPTKNKDFDMQEATWGIQARDGWDKTDSFTAPTVAAPPSVQPAVQQDIFSAAQRIENPMQNQQQAFAPSQQNLQAPQQILQPEPVQPFKQPQQPAKGAIDTSFLDDLL
ncbi:MAG TPA: hypothetical protein EYG33_02670 [Candidatus Poseidoniales archaeon]|nr:hypothetical protein [Candidatus Poseidoniales archaeon]